MKQTPKEGKLTPDVREFVESLKNQPPIQNNTYEEARSILSRLQADQSFKGDVERDDYEVPLPDGSVVSTRIVRRTEEEGHLPIIFYIHGGGWVMGNAMIYDRVLRKIARATHAAVVFVEYAVAPDASYPTPLKQLWSALEHILNNKDIYRIDPARLIMMGDSAGGNMAAVLTQYAKQQGVAVDFQLLLYPVTDARMETPSYQEFENGPWLTKAGMEWFWKAYAPEEQERTHPMISPLLFPPEELKGLPPTLVITAQNDVLRDEGEMYAAHLAEAGVPAASVRINGTIHDFVMLAPLAHSMPTKIAFRLIEGTLRHVLHKAIKSTEVHETDLKKEN